MRFVASSTRNPVFLFGIALIFTFFARALCVVCVVFSSIFIRCVCVRALSLIPNRTQRLFDVQNRSVGRLVGWLLVTTMSLQRIKTKRTNEFENILLYVYIYNTCKYSSTIEPAHNINFYICVYIASNMNTAPHAYIHISTTIEAHTSTLIQINTISIHLSIHPSI